MLSCMAAYGMTTPYRVMATYMIIELAGVPTSVLNADTEWVVAGNSINLPLYPCPALLNTSRGWINFA